MAKRPSLPFGKLPPFSWQARALLEVRRGWFAYLVGGLLFALGLTLWPRYAAFVGADGEPTVATIVGLTPVSDKGKLGVLAKSSGGLEGVVVVSPSQIARCRLGDQIAASIVDGRLRPEPAPCTTHGTIGARPIR